VTPRWVVAPGSVPELGRVVALAREERLAVVPRGSGSAMALGHPVGRPHVVVDLGRMNHIVEYNPDDLTATVQAGTTLERFAALLRPRAQVLPLDPPGGPRRTLGGLAATGASGPLRLRYGTLRDLLLGVRFVQADGVVTWGGAKVVKSVTGYDVPKLMVGALGTLGVLAELTLRLHPAPACERTSLAAFPSAGAAQAFVAAQDSRSPGRVEAECAAGSPGTTRAVAISSGASRRCDAGGADRRAGPRAGGSWRPVDEHVGHHAERRVPARRDRRAWRPWQSPRRSPGSRTRRSDGSRRS
jgi:FAD/FMN-containing dehydrogenase